MPPEPDDQVNRELERFRAYLQTLTFLQIDPRLRAQVGFSDVVQVTLLEAFKALDRLRGLDEPKQKEFLARMLYHNLLDEVDRFRAARRDVRLERSLEEAADHSSRRLRDCLAAGDDAPDARMLREEQAAALLDALSQLPPRQREAIILQRYHGWTLARIAEHLGCTVGAVAGLHAHGLKALRQFLGHRKGDFDA